MGTRSFIAVILALLGLGLLGLWYWDTPREDRLLIAAGQRSGYAFQIATALKQVTERHFPELTLEVFETRGSLHDASLLDQGAVQLATVQADQTSGRAARLVAELYPDSFQIVVRRDSGIDAIGDLVGKRIALPPRKSGEYESFWFLAKHYDLREEDLKIFTGTERTTDWLLLNGDVDALFRVRAPGDASILNLIRRIDGKIIPIPQAAALRLQHPAFELGVIPQGSYNGRPAIPDKEQPTISVKQLLVARADVPADAIAKITSILFEHRRELMDIVPLAGAISAPARSGESYLPIHAGVWAFWDRDKPSFIQENAEPIALMISIAVVVTSAYLQWANRRRKRAMDVYNRELIELAHRARNAPDFETLDECNVLLAEFVGRIVQATEHGRINAAEFTLFNFTYDAVEDAIKDRQSQLERGVKQERKRAPLGPPATIPVPS
ncbi:MAG: TAXI family TRAP transporter solute-binding subunit [Methyloceanibacter sp.]|jgi:TRAP transporter TAXI family solute receptor